MESQEKANENAKVIHGGQNKARVSVSMVQKSKGQGQMAMNQRQNAMSNQMKQVLVCFGCGKPSHRVYSAECPAKQATCGLCHRVGHFKAFCQSKSSTALVSGKSGEKHWAFASNKCLCLPTCMAGNVRATDSHGPKLAEPIYGTIELEHQNFSSKFMLKAEWIPGLTALSLPAQFSTLHSLEMSSMTCSVPF